MTKEQQLSMLGLFAIAFTKVVKRYWMLTKNHGKE